MIKIDKKNSCRSKRSKINVINTYCTNKVIEIKFNLTQKDTKRQKKFSKAVVKKKLMGKEL